jgi:hypothetical protein
VTGEVIDYLGFLEREEGLVMAARGDDRAGGMGRMRRIRIRGISGRMSTIARIFPILPIVIHGFS